MSELESDGIAEEIIEHIQNQFQILNSWPLDNLSWKRKFFKYSCLILIITPFLLTFIQTLRDTDMFTITFGLCGVITMLDTSAKYLSLFLNKSLFVKILHYFKNPLFIPQENDYKQFLIDRIRRWELFRKAYLYWIIISAALAAISPIPYLNSDRILPMPSPCDMNNQPFIFFLFIWCIQSYAVLYVGLQIAAFDTLLIVLMDIAAAQLKILGYRIINIHLIDVKNHELEQLTPDIERDRAINKSLQKCVIHHMAIERYISLIQDTFKYPFFVQVGASLVLICLMAFNILALPIISVDAAKVVFLLGCFLSQVIMYCLLGNEIIQNSEKIREACYMSEWNTFGPLVRKSLIIIMQRSQRPFALTAAQFATLSLETLLSILKSTFSYFTVLWHLYTNSHHL